MSQQRTWKKGEQLSAMLLLVVEKFAGVFDRGGNPYVLHCLKVMHYVRADDDEELACSSVGHDLLEDCYPTIEEGVADLRARGFTERVIADILSVTKIPGEPYEAYQVKVLASPRACRIKKADLRHNSDIRRLKGLREKDMQRLQKYYAFYTAILAVEQAQALDRPI